jgi:hypothetical protein
MEQRLIDANAILNENGNSFKFGDETYYHESIIQNAPTVDAVPVVHGHWEIVPNDENTDGYYKMRCSVCGEILWSIQSEELYCCKCGAKMDECADGERRSE